MGDRQEQGGTEGHLVAWAVGEARRIRMLGLRIPRALIDGTSGLPVTAVTPAMAADWAVEDTLMEGPATFD